MREKVEAALPLSSEAPIEGESQGKPKEETN
jgi:hypothetical protein